MLPDPVLDRVPPGALVVEVGVGGRFATLEALAEARPALHLRAVDVDPAALDGAPSTIETHVDDVMDPRWLLYRDAALVFAQRAPAELQPAIARLARAVDADLALRALKDEWADLDAILGDPRRPDAEEPWRWWPT